MSIKFEYARRDIESLDEVGGFYSRHVSAMTREGLFTKADIAAELGHRDMVISELFESLEMLIVFTTPTKRNSAALNKAYAAIAKALGESQ